MLTRDVTNKLKVDLGQKELDSFKDVVGRWWDAVRQRWELTRTRASMNGMVVPEVDLSFDLTVIKFARSGEIRIFVAGGESSFGISGLLGSSGFEWKHLDEIREKTSTLIESVWKKTNDEIEFRKQYLQRQDRDQKFIEDIAEWEIIRD